MKQATEILTTFVAGELPPEPTGREFAIYRLCEPQPWHEGCDVWRYPGRDEPIVFDTNLIDYLTHNVYGDGEANVLGSIWSDGGDTLVCGKSGRRFELVDVEPVWLGCKEGGAWAWKHRVRELPKGEVVR